MNFNFDSHALTCNFNPFPPLTLLLCALLQSTALDTHRLLNSSPYSSAFRDWQTPMRLEEIVTNHQSSQVLVIIAVSPLFSCFQQSSQDIEINSDLMLLLLCSTIEDARVGWEGAFDLGEQSINKESRRRRRKGTIIFLRLTYYVLIQSSKSSIVMLYINLRRLVYAVKHQSSYIEPYVHNTFIHTYY